MKTLKANNSEELILLDDEDYERVAALKWRFSGEAVQRFYYESNKLVSISIAAFIMQQPDTMFDHIDRNPLNNQKNNLRMCNHSQNGMNRTKRNNCSSKYKGVYWNKRDKKWISSIRLNNRLTHLGCFNLETDAAKAYNTAATKHFKEFANINQI